jgi:hypothetical protein
VGLVNPPAGYRGRLQPLPEGAAMVKSTTSAVDVLQVFVRDTADLQKLDPKVFKWSSLTESSGSATRRAARTPPT